MIKIFSDIGDLLTQLRFVDFLFVFLIIIFMIVLISIIYFVKLGKVSDENIKQDIIENKDFDLESVTKELEDNYENLTITPTRYENEMEENAIISYEELIEHTGEYSLQYDDEYDSKTEELEVKKIKGAIVNSESKTLINKEINYEEQEDFLNRLKNYNN